MVIFIEKLTDDDDFIVVSINIAMVFLSKLLLWWLIFALAG